MRQDSLSMITLHGKGSDHMTTKSYKNMLIDGILEFQTKNQWTRELLIKKSIRVLEIIYENVE